MAPLRTGDARAFSFRMDIDAMAEQLVAYCSWAPPDRRCLILCDRVDGLPLAVVVDGKAYMYDLIGGQILLIRTEPQLLTRVSDRGEKVSFQWGVRGDFPDEASRTTIDVDFRGIMAGAARKDFDGLAVEREPRVATYRGFSKDFELRAAAGEPVVPELFVLKMDNGSKRVHMRFGSFVFGAADVPAWHRPIDRVVLANQVPVVAVADIDAQPPEKRQRMETFRKLNAGGGLYILRPALRDDALRQRIEKNSPLKLDFDEIRRNDEKLRDPWRLALRRQGIDMPVPPDPDRK